MTRLSTKATSGSEKPMLERETVIELTSLSKQFRGWLALNDVDLDISNRVTGLLGPNGSGKSTLIKHVLGLIAPTSGSGTVFGLDIQQDRLAIRQRLGYMPEDDCYIDGITGVEMVQMSGQFFGIDRREALRRAHEILDFCGFRQERYREISGYSTGMRQQIKFAAAIVHNPDFLILDEPTSGLDPEERERLLWRVQFLNREFGMGVLLSTHILPDVQLICDEVAILAGGQVRSHKLLSDLQTKRQWIVRIDLSQRQEMQRFEEQARHLGFDCQWDKNAEAFSLMTDNTATEEISTRIWQLADTANVQIRQLFPTEESLEQIFLKTIEGTTNATS